MKQMKVAFVINDLSGGGAEKALLHLASYLHGSGLEVSVLTLQSGNDAYQLPAGLQHITLSTQRLARGAGRILALPLQGREIARLLDELDADLCVSFLPRANVAHVMSRWFGNRRPILATEQVSSRDAYPSNRPGDRLMRRLIQWFYPRADAVFPSSTGVMDGLRRFGISPDRMRVVYNSVVLEEIRKFAAEPVLALDGEQMPTVITVGRHVYQKDHQTLLHAFAKVRRKLTARLVFLGQGPMREELEALAGELGIADDVFFAGFQKNPFAWLAKSSLFVLSSRYEGFGNVVIEAMACGLPIVSTDCPSGPAEILKDGETGLLVPVEDANAMAAAIQTLLEDSEAHAKYANLAVERAEDFDISVVGQQYHELLESQFSVHARGRLLQHS